MNSLASGSSAAVSWDARDKEDMDGVMFSTTGVGSADSEVTVFPTVLSDASPYSGSLTMLLSELLSTVLSSVSVCSILLSERTSVMGSRGVLSWLGLLLAGMGSGEALLGVMVSPMPSSGGSLSSVLGKSVKAASGGAGEILFGVMVTVSLMLNSGRSSSSSSFLGNR